MLNLGLIGLGPDWDAVYAPALRRQSHRLRVTAVYDAVAGRAVQAADQLRAWPTTGMRALLDRHDVRAVLVLGSGWHGLAAIELAIEHGTPALVGAPFEATPAELDRMHASAVAAGILMMPGLPLRSTPAAARLRELTATHLGPPQRILVKVAGNIAFNSPLLAAIIDWCSQAAQAPPIEIGALQPGGNGAEGVQMRIVLQRPGSSRPPVALEVRGGEPRASETGQDDDDGSSFQASIECQGGRAELLSPTRIRWESASQTGDETLNKDRSGVEVILDCFARRVVGGLIPVPDLAEVSRILKPLIDERSTGGLYA